MPPTATVARQINPFHRANRLAAVVDMANFLVTQTAVRWPEATYAESVDHALAFACGLTDAQWVELGERTSHYLADGAVPAEETCRDVLAQLESMIPAVGQADPFEGLP